LIRATITETKYMYDRTRLQWQGQRGFSLTEILVAVAIFTVLMVAALTLYDRSNKVFKQANEAAEMQQNTRVAFEKIVSEVRMAGFDYKRTGIPSVGTPTEWVADRNYTVGALVTPTTDNGHVYVAIQSGMSDDTEPTWLTGDGSETPDNTVRWKETGVPVYEQPDEQIEHAGLAAITIRANLDYDTDGTAGKGRETALETASLGHFPVVTTGNDEIVTYALRSRKPGFTHTESVTFYADVNDANTTPNRRSYPGGAVERLITIPDIDTTNDNPPYSLMRFTIKDDGTIQETVLADNIRSMEFQYWEDFAATVPLKDEDGDEVPNIGGVGQYDPDHPAEFIQGRAVRSKIRAVTVTLVGMNPQKDATYTHPSDTDSDSKNYRQYELTSTIVGRNLGLQGVPQADTEAPDPPSIDSVCFGYCGIAVVEWTPAEGTIDTTYTVLLDDDEDGSYSAAFPAGTQTRFAINMTQEDLTKTWYVKVAATNAGGTTLSEGDPVAVSLVNVTKPATPTDVEATFGDVATPSANKITLTWTTPTTVASGTPSCLPVSETPFYTGSTAALQSEIRGFRIYRSQTAGFAIDDPTATLIYREGSTGATSDGNGNWTYVDTAVANCETYYYRVATLEWCDAAAENTGNDANLGLSAASGIATGRAYSTVLPAAPTNLAYDPLNECDESANTCNPVNLSWTAVTANTAGTAINVTDYAIYRRQKKNNSFTQSAQLAGTVSNGSTTFTDTATLLHHDTDNVRFYYEYTVQAYYGYGDCNQGGAQSAALTYPGECETRATVGASALGGSGTEGDPYTDVDVITVTEHPSRALTSVKYVIDPVGDGTDTWTTLTAPYEVEWNEVTDAAKVDVRFEIKTSGCTEYETVWIQNDAPACTPSALVMNVTSSESQAEITIKNTESEAISLTTFAIEWLGQTGLSWNSITLPSGASMAATGTASAAREVRFTPANATPVNAIDRSIPANSTYKVKMIFTGTGVPAQPVKVGNVNIVYTRPSLGTLPIDCDASPLTVCNVTSSAATTADNRQLRLTFTNSSVEDLNLREIKLTTTGINKWTWRGIILENGTGATHTMTTGNTLQNTDVTSTIDVTGNNVIIPARGTYSIIVFWEKTATGGGSIAPAITDIPFVQLTYRTAGSGTTDMICITQ
jgi:prepilin-type N-terminal cleavage/methylation domain-containing protein